MQANNLSQNIEFMDDKEGSMEDLPTIVPGGITVKKVFFNKEEAADILNFYGTRLLSYKMRKELDLPEEQLRLNMKLEMSFNIDDKVTLDFVQMSEFLCEISDMLQENQD